MQINVIQHINEMKDENCVIISIGAEKAFDKIQHPFMINSQEWVQREHTSTVKAMYDKPTTKNIFKSGKLKVFHLRSEQDKDVYSCHF